MTKHAIAEPMSPRFEVVEMWSRPNIETRWHVTHAPDQTIGQLWSIAHQFDTEMEARMKCAIWNDMGWLRYRWFVFTKIRRWEY